MGDLGGLVARPRCRGMGGEVARGGDEDRRCLLVTVPGEVLSHGGLQILHHVEAGVLAKERVAQKRNEIGGPMASGNVVRRQPRGFGDLLLAPTNASFSTSRACARAKGPSNCWIEQVG
jgi:hypothetical protein